MSAETQPFADYNPPSSYEAYAKSVWETALIHMQNRDTWSYSPILIEGLYQQSYAESMVARLRRDPALCKFGGKTLQIVTIPTDEPYMYHVGLIVEDSRSLRSI